MTGHRDWREFVAAAAEHAVAEQALVRLRWEPAVLAAARGSGRQPLHACRFLADRRRLDPRSTAVVHGELDLFVRLATEGGLEQPVAAELVAAAPSDRRHEALRAAVDRVLAADGDRTRELMGLLPLLDRTGEQRLLDRVLAAARASTDPDVADLAEDHWWVAGPASAPRLRSGPADGPAPPASPADLGSPAEPGLSPVEPGPSVAEGGPSVAEGGPSVAEGGVAAARLAWNRYAAAAERRSLAFHALRPALPDAVPAEQLRREPAATRDLLGILSGSPNPADVELAGAVRRLSGAAERAQAGRDLAADPRPADRLPSGNRPSAADSGPAVRP